MTTEQRSEFQHVILGYGGFQVAMLWLCFSEGDRISHESAIAAMLAISIPSTIAHVGLWDRKDWRSPVSFLMTFIPSTAAISVLLYSLSVFAAIAFPITISIWLVDAVNRRIRARHVIQPSK